LPVQVPVAFVTAIQTILVAALDFDYAGHTLTPVRLQWWRRWLSPRPSR
jgi:hypothetical protein